MKAFKRSTAQYVVASSAEHPLYFDFDFLNFQKKIGNEAMHSSGEGAFVKRGRPTPRGVVIAAVRRLKTKTTDHADT